MPKRKAAAEQGSDADTTHPHQQETETSPAKHSKRLKNKPAPSDDGDGTPLVKKATQNKKDTKPKKAAGKADGASKLDLSADAGYVQLGGKRRATVRSFKGRPFIDIREFYGDDGDEKPGKKGISLSVEQWNELKKNMSTIDDLISELPE